MVVCENLNIFMESIEWQKDNCIYTKRQVFSLLFQYKSGENFSPAFIGTDLRLQSTKKQGDTCVVL